MGLDKEQLYSQISRLEEALKDLKKIEDKIKEKRTRYAIERLLQTLIEEGINIGNHIISGLGLRRAESYRDVFKILEEEK